MRKNLLYLSLPLLLFFLSFLAFPACASRVPDAKSLSLNELTGQMVMLGFRGTVFSPASPVGQDIIERGLGGVILFDQDILRKGAARNIVSPRQLTSLTGALQKAAPVPLLIGIDQEGGRVSRLKPQYGFRAFPTAASLGKNSPEETYLWAVRMGEDLAEAGVNVNFAPVADLASNPDSPVIARLERAFSPLPEIVSQHDEAFLAGLAAKNVIGCLKHFPGHGSAGTDTHLGSADITGSWREEELIPYASLIKKNKVPMIMVGHLRHDGIDPSLPASLSPRFVTDILRNRLGFDGVVISDDLQMKAIRDFYTLEEVVRLSLKAGVDILLFGNNMDYDPHLLPRIQQIVQKLVAEGSVSRAQLEASCRRILRLKTSLKAHDYDAHRPL